MRKYILLGGFLMLWGCGSSKNLQYVVPELDLERYMGTWYEIARFNHTFERGLISNQAKYTLRNDGKVQVLNTGIESDNPEKVKKAEAVAYRASEKKNGHMKVRFFPLISSHYIVIDLDKNYQYAVVTSNSKKYLWILSRSKTMNETLYQQLTDKLQKRGFKTQNLIRVSQL
ncbi:MAG: lipocalin family protein [Fidelibacterota bacterium]